MQIYLMNPNGLAWQIKLSNNFPDCQTKLRSETVIHQLEYNLICIQFKLLYVPI